MKRSASAVWKGSLKDGGGALSSPSGVLDDTPYSFKTRFGEGVTGTNPEELIAAAHAGCFTMALSNALSQAGHPPTEIDTTATVQLDQVEGGFSISKVDLVTKATVPGVTADEFASFAKGAKENCPVSKLLKAEITLDAKLAG
ncbi:OsmC family protein [Acuticoccus sp. M5D2P5]|uniref:OsmC family protein n=1 Tax=Acuticoccus kalidii TaxID=2910977 RepID=UPI001F280124|nr:OsmC family protein [Acuticoccus kalidii]MCF3932410.1 OsmC family protein [Acuticoccus kalidii]